MLAQGDDKEIEELTKRKLSENMVENQISDIVANLESVVEWKTNAIGDDVSMGDHDDIPFNIYEELEALGEGEITHRRLIQQFKLDIYEEEEIQ